MIWRKRNPSDQEPKSQSFIKNKEDSIVSGPITVYINVKQSRENSRDNRSDGHLKSPTLLSILGEVGHKLWEWLCSRRSK